MGSKSTIREASMTETETKIPAGRYSVRGTVTIYTDVEVTEAGEVRVLRDRVSVESHEVGPGNSGDSVWGEGDSGVPSAVRFALIDRLNSDDSAWDNSDGLRFE
jgi:hypothetical protein